MTPEIRLLTEASELLAVEKLQAKVWGGTRVVPAHLLMAITHSGGIVLGAYEDEKQIVFTFSFPGVNEADHKPKQSSHMLAVDPQYQGQGIGFALKRAQWQMARKKDVELITWTFDPLMSKNAFLNLVKLGAVSKTYIRNLYGELEDELNQGVESDRFMVEWWLNSDRVNSRLSKNPRGPLAINDIYSAGAILLNESKLSKQVLPEPADKTIEIDPSPKHRPKIVLIEIPSNYQAIKNDDLDLAVAWRLHSREIFERLFPIGYIVSDFIFIANEHPRSFYVLSDGQATLGD
jgi:predicted GNAT superfamily acetyltransferase